MLDNSMYYTTNSYLLILPYRTTIFSTLLEYELEFRKVDKSFHN